MNAFPRRLPLHIEAVQVKQKSSLMTPLISCILLAAGGATDLAAAVATGHGILAETGWPMEAQLGLSAVFLAGFCWSAKLLLSAHNERIGEWRQRYEAEREEKNALIKRLREMQDARDKRLEELDK